ncbi:hypothetical protein ACERK3_12275 [Phycisphaerales bacterium AB-hyl4]|uniref:Uncharacterized protein n=1 Tax=Natronomicrosphaera hydrolytica TaxID=3242702 RepID=A0ABV4U631_9BACT
MVLLLHQLVDRSTGNTIGRGLVANRRRRLPPHRHHHLPPQTVHQLELVGQRTPLFTQPGEQRRVHRLARRRFTDSAGGVIRARPGLSRRVLEAVRLTPPRAALPGVITGVTLPAATRQTVPTRH